MIYADNAATTKISDRVLEEMLPFLRELYGNASSLYSLGAKAKRAINRSRQQVATAIGANPAEIIFTSGGSEGNSWVLQNAAAFWSKKGDAPPHIITSAIEHPSVLNTCRVLEKRGASVTYLPVDRSGSISIAAVMSALHPETKLVTIMMANNEVGTIQPIAAIGKMLRCRGILFHTDAVQAVGHLPVDVKELHVDFLTASAHKFNGPKGIGFVYARSGTLLPQLVIGGEQEHGRRAGTENVAGIVALGSAIEENMSIMPDERERLFTLVRETAANLRATIPELSINADSADRLPGVLNVTFPSVSGEAMLHLLDLKGICISTSSACNSGKNEPSHVLLAMGLTTEQAMSSIRISFGRYNTLEEARAIAKAVCDAYWKIMGAKIS